MDYENKAKDILVTPVRHLAMLSDSNKVFFFGIVQVPFRS